MPGLETRRDDRTEKWVADQAKPQGNARFKHQDPWVFSHKHQPKRNIHKIVHQNQNIMTNPAFSLRDAKKRRLLQDTVPQLISWKQYKKRRL